MTNLVAWLQANNGAVIAIATVVGVLVAAVYAFFTWRLWQETRRQADLTQKLWIAAEAQAQLTQGLWEATKRQADITQRMFEASHRPYVSIWMYNPSTFFVRDEFFRFFFYVENHGEVPAVIDHWSAQVFRDGNKIAETERTEPTPCLYPGEKEMLEFEGSQRGGLVNQPEEGVRIEANLTYLGSHERLYSTRLVVDRRNGEWVRSRYQVT